MSTLDDIINKIVVEERQKTEVSVTDLVWLSYRCIEHNYNIRYNEDLEKAQYYFDGQAGCIEVDIPVAQRNYYVDSGYWKYAN